MNKISDVAIIGAGPVGIFSVFACGMQNLSCVLIDAQDKLGGQCISVYPEKDIYDIPGFPSITGKQLIENLSEQALTFEPIIELNSFVKNIKMEDDIFSLEVANNGVQKKIQAKSIIIALGGGIFQPVKLALAEIENFENEHIFYSIDDLKKFDNKNIAIIGGGDSAIDWALQLHQQANNIFLIHRREYIKAHPASWQKVQQLKNVHLKIPYSIESLIKNNVLNINIKDIIKNIIEEIEIDFVLPCLGAKSNIEFLSNWQKELNLQLKSNRILIDQSNMRTSLKNVYAIGDCVYYENKRKLIAVGFSEAFICAKDIFTQLYPEKAPIIGHSTSFGKPGKQN